MSFDKIFDLTAGVNLSFLQQVVILQVVYAVDGTG